MNRPQPESGTRRCIIVLAYEQLGLRRVDSASKILPDTVFLHKERGISSQARGLSWRSSAPVGTCVRNMLDGAIFGV